jgi:hypothetical protein
MTWQFTLCEPFHRELAVLDWYPRHMKYIHWLSLALLLGMLAPPASAQPGEAVIQGYVWVDENLNGVYDSEEPLLRNQELTLNENYRPRFLETPTGLLRSHQIDNDGRFTVRVPASRTVWTLGMVWGEPVSFFGEDPVGWPYRGCASIHGAQAGATYTLDVRVRPTYQPFTRDGQPQLGRRPMMAPAMWPIAGGMFFLQDSAISGLMYDCDSGFAVTNEQDIPYWDTLLASGLDTLGRPVTGRFLWEGRARQGFEHKVLEWDSDSQAMLVLTWDESGMTRGSTGDEPFAPGPSPHFLGLPSMGGGADAPMADVDPPNKVLTAPNNTQSLDELALVQGYLWVDENLNAAYDPGEPFADVASIYQNGRLWSFTETDDEGRFSVWLPVGYLYAFESQWGEVVERFSDGSPFLLANKGCAGLWIREGGVDLVLHLRLRTTSLSGATFGRPVAEPTRWPVDNGEFFTFDHPERDTEGDGCDQGFSVTDDEGIPFWQTLQIRGVAEIGKPVTGRFLWDDRVRQGFERAVLEWRPRTLEVRVLSWEEAGMERGLPFREPLFWPMSVGHYQGLPPLHSLAD